MPPFIQFVLRRLIYAIVSLFIITLVLYSGVMITPAEARAELYLPPGRGGERASQNYLDRAIEMHHLNEPFWVQYGYWAKSLLSGSWGYSPTLNADVLPSLLRRTPTTIELAIWSLALIVPLGLASGVRSGWRPGGAFDHGFRSAAFLGTSMPPFILAMVLLAFFYIRLHWFEPGQLDPLTNMRLEADGFRPFTGMLTIDSLLNGRPDVFVSALRHLGMPVLTLLAYHWATLGRITRATVMQERSREYVVAARARGVVENQIVWRHLLGNVMAPALTSMALSAAAMVTGIFVVEIVFALDGVSEVIVIAMQSAPDASAALGFSVYSILMVIGLMFLLDVLQAAVDPRVREEILKT